ncbi:FdhF/YdeP family oxidoreductase [Agaribacterium haliotis]|uniref:FdhF/YdeP family oxidoreductase n=1 Tax=Agaribacterium haliotis TaxID=2013869 RepID=UPI000BB5631D|nr:FdhF/YdeP family oxidoreductase [Agaribacterium haliotis]
MATAGGFKAIRSVWRYALKIGPINLYKTVTSKNACKACAFGTGGQSGGIWNERHHGIEICNKNIQAHLSDIREGIANPVFMQRSIKELSKLSGKELEDLGRLVTPLYKQAGDSHYSPISYDEALEKISAKLQNTEPKRSFFYASGRSSNEAAFSMQLMARLWGSNNINNCSYYCHQASGEGLTATVGTSTATIEYDDLYDADTIFVFGANPASNHPRFVKTLIECRRRGGQVVVINPAKELGMQRFASPSDIKSMLVGGEKVASHYCQPHLGGDLALMLGIAKALIEKGQIDHEFIKHHTEGFSVFDAHVRAQKWGELVEASGVSEEEIRQIATIYAKSNNTVFTWSMGLTHHLHGVGNIESLAALAMLRGMLGKKGAGLMPLRGHSNIQGTGTMGFTPSLKAPVKAALEKELSHHFSEEPGLDTMACMNAAANGDMDVAINLGGNLLASNPDTQYASEALNNIPFKLYINSTLNMSHVNGVDQEVIVLPIRVRDEEKQATTQESMFNFVRMSDGGIDRFPQLRSEVDLITDLASRIVPKQVFDFSQLREHKAIRQLTAKVVSGMDKMADIDNNKKEFHISGRILHEPKFNTPDGKAQFKSHDFAKRGEQAFVLSSIRSEAQFNSIVFDERDSYRGQAHRWVLMMNKDDIRELGFEPGDKVDVSTDTGEMKALELSAFDVRRGNVLAYYPEANVLIPRTTDSRSHTPAFKSVAVNIAKASAV